MLGTHWSHLGSFYNSPRTQATFQTNDITISDVNEVTPGPQYYFEASLVMPDACSLEMITQSLQEVEGWV